MMASSPPPISNSSSTLFHDRFLKHGSSSSTNASVVLPSGRELQAEVSDFKMGTNQTSPTKNSSFSLIKKPSTAEDTNASLSETPTKAPTEKGKKIKLENKKSKALQRVTNPAYKKGISSGYGIDLDTDSDDDSVRAYFRLFKLESYVGIGHPGCGPTKAQAHCQSCRFCEYIRLPDHRAFGSFF